MKKRIKSCWLFTCIDPQDDVEGLIGEKIGDTWIPFVACDEDRIEQLASRAKVIGDISGRKVRVKKALVMTDQPLSDFLKELGGNS